MNRKEWDKTLSIALTVGILISVVTTISVIFLMTKESYHFFSLVSWKDFFFTGQWEPLIEPKTFGVWPLVVGTLMIAIGSIIIALPLGLAAAFYMSEMASQTMRSILKPVLEVLAGVPTVVYGFFALTVITPLIRVVFPDTQIFNALSATIVVAIMILPMIASLCDDAFRAVPMSLREGGYSLGATSNEVMLGVLLPAAKDRVVAAVLLAISRAAGETMAVTLAAGSTPHLSLNFLESTQTMTAFIVQVALGDVAAGGVEYLSSFAVGALLFVMTFFLNGIGTYLVFKAPKGIS
jgi:phosphate transport system permease protein